MRISAINYTLLSIGAFVLAFLVQMLIVPHYVPTPTAEDFNHPLVVTGRYGYYASSRGGNTTWVNDTQIFCGAGALDFWSCGRVSLANGAQITAEIVHLKRRGDDMVMAMSIKSLGRAGRDVFSQIPIQCINAWRDDNNHWFAWYSLMFAFLVTSFTHIFLTRGKTS